jgi:hypothetical protein
LAGLGLAWCWEAFLFLWICRTGRALVRVGTNDFRIGTWWEKFQVCAAHTCTSYDQFDAQHIFRNIVNGPPAAAKNNLWSESSVTHPMIQTEKKCFCFGDNCAHCNVMSDTNV